MFRSLLLLALSFYSASAFLSVAPNQHAVATSFTPPSRSVDVGQDRAVLRRVAFARMRGHGSQLNAAASSDSSTPVKLIIAGAPASGKGTQCEVIKEKFGVVHLSTGDMLRAAVAAETAVGKKAKDFMDSGKLVPDEVIIGVVSLNSQGSLA